MEAISVITEVQRRRRFSIADKLRAVRESSAPEKWPRLVGQFFMGVNEGFCPAGLDGNSRRG